MAKIDDTLAKSLFSWETNPPEFVTEDMWYVTITDNNITNAPQVYAKDYFNSPLGFDTYINKVDIPQLKLKFDKTDFDMLNFEQKEPYESFSLSFSDDIQGRCQKFFNEWLTSIISYTSTNLYRLKTGWRSKYKDIKCTYIKALTHKQGYLSEFARSTVMSTFSVGSMANISSAIGQMEFKNSLNFENIEVKDCFTYEMKYCYPTGLDKIDADSTSGDLKAFSVDFECQEINHVFKFESISNTSDKRNLWSSIVRAIGG